jgi:hypothetical protein
MLFVIVFFSPFIVAVFALIVVLIAKKAKLSKPSLTYLVSRSFVFAAIGAVSSLTAYHCLDYLVRAFDGLQCESNATRLDILFWTA